MKVLILFSIVILTIGTYCWFAIQPRLGTRPSGAYLNKLKSSSNFNTDEGRFVNQNEAIITMAREDIDHLKMMGEFIFSKNQVTPKSKLPEVKPDLDAFIKPSEQLKFIWLGHSTFLLNMSVKIILIDPVFSKAAAPLDFLSNRFQKPVITLEELPKIDFIVISHDHYDNLDMKSISYFKDSDTRFLVPLGVSSHLLGWGINLSKVTELDWWQSTKKEEIEFICTPAQHFSGRLIPYDNKTLWASWVIKDTKTNIFYSGDSGYGDHFKEIGNKHGPFDVSFIENGQYNKRWRPVHVFPEETAQAYFDVKSKVLVPVHWGMFSISMHSWYEPIEEIERLSKKKNINLMTPKIGQVVELGKKIKFDLWWKDLIK